MKKFFVILCTLFLLTGCTNTKTANLDNLINNALTSKIKSTNVYRRGYDYYLPVGLRSVDSTDYNEVIRDAQYKYFLYVDIISYFNKKNDNYKISNEAFLSRKINYGKNSGYLEVNEYKNSKYLIEIMYNYAKIEVMVDYEDINEVVTYAVSILSSVLSISFYNHSPKLIRRHAPCACLPGFLIYQKNFFCSSDSAFSHHTSVHLLVLHSHPTHPSLSGRSRHNRYLLQSDTAVRKLHSYLTIPFPACV